MEQQLEEEEAAAEEMYMDYRLNINLDLNGLIIYDLDFDLRASMTSSMSTTAAMTRMRRRALMHHGRGIHQRSSSSHCSSSSEAEQEAATFQNRRCNYNLQLMVQGGSSARGLAFVVFKFKIPLQDKLLIMKRNF